MNILIEARICYQAATPYYLVRAWEGEKEKLLQQESASVGTVVKTRNRMIDSWTQRDEVDEVKALPIKWPLELR